MDARPHPDYDRIRDALRRYLESGSAKPWSGKVYRSVSKKYANEENAASGAGAQQDGGRWNAKGSFPVVYMSTVREVAEAETARRSAAAGIPPGKARAFVTLEAEVALEMIVDMGESELLEALGVTTDGLRFDEWEEATAQDVETMTQAIGRAAHELGLQGLLVPSHVSEEGANLVLLRDHAGDDVFVSSFVEIG